jgi:hypothetical protein
MITATGDKRTSIEPSYPGEPELHARHGLAQRFLGGKVPIGEAPTEALHFDRAGEVDAERGGGVGPRYRGWVVGFLAEILKHGHLARCLSSGVVGLSCAYRQLSVRLADESWRQDFIECLQVSQVHVSHPARHALSTNSGSEKIRAFL